MRKTTRRNLLIQRAYSGWDPAFVAHVVVAQLSDELAALLGVSTLAKQILAPLQGKHIREQRPAEAQAIIASIRDALSHITYYGSRQDLPEHTLVGELHNNRRLLVGIKFIPAIRASSNKDEALITTAHYLSQAKLQQKLDNGQLFPVDLADSPP